jgi:serine phosphatase RsbU (regulator of sigma subunit)
MGCLKIYVAVQKESNMADVAQPSLSAEEDAPIIADDEEFLTFVDEESSSTGSTSAGWPVMIVDDEPEIHNITMLSLAEFTFQDKPLTFLNAYSGQQARQLIQAHPDTALILLDVVMETDDAGLTVVKYIREELRNHRVRIVLRTGQPGQAPEEKVIVDYDINDYKAKTELTTQKLFTTVVTALRSFHHMTTIEHLTTEKLRLETELELARQLQQMLLPTKEELRQIKQLDIAGLIEPAEEVSGDYYDVLEHNGQVKIGIGDVNGHGLQSGIVIMMAQVGVRTLLTSDETDPTRFSSILRQTIYTNLQRMQAENNLSLALLDYQSGQLRLSGQHKEVLIVRQDGRVELLAPTDETDPLDFEDNLANFATQALVQLQPGDGAVLYTDGLTSAENLAGESYPLTRLCEVVSQHWTRPAEAIKQAVMADVHRHMGQQKVQNDLTLLVIKQR